MPGAPRRDPIQDRDLVCWPLKTPARWRCNSRMCYLLPPLGPDCESETPRKSSFADDCANALRREIVLPDVNAIETGGEAKIGAVVHDELYRVRSVASIREHEQGSRRELPDLLRYCNRVTPPQASSRPAVRRAASSGNKVGSRIAYQARQRDHFMVYPNHSRA